MADYLEPYRDAVEKLGPGFESLLWRSREYQEIRFKVLLEVAATGLAGPGQLGTVLRLEDETIADLGAGQADLAIWMHRIGLKCRRYIGVEAIGHLATRARQGLEEHGLAHASIIESDFAADATLFDRLVRDEGAKVLLFSGSLNTFEQADAERVIRHAFRAIAGVENAAVVFNFLSDLGATGSADTGPARRFRTLDLVRSLSRSSQRFTLRQDYLAGHDATIGLFSAR